MSASLQATEKSFLKNSFQEIFKATHKTLCSRTDDGNTLKVIEVSGG
jgi:hypothetical protein